MDKLWLDLETYSECDLPSHGTVRYATHPTTEIMLFGYALNDGPAGVTDFTAGEALPQWVVEAMRDDGVALNALNSFFDRTLLAEAGSFKTRRERWRDTMVKAYCASLPGALAKIGPILGVGVDLQKDADDKALVQLFCKPRPKNQKLRRATRLTHPDEWARFKAYCQQDVVAMRAADAKLPSWNYNDTPGTPGARELALWHLDQRINDRGFYVDIELAHAAIRAGGDAKEALDDEIEAATEGNITSATKRDALMKYIVESYGVKLPDMRADTLRRRVDDPELPDAVRQMLRIRLQASMTTRSKYATLVRAVSADGRLRNTLQFGGAQRTLRWSGKLFQPQNLKRPDMDAEDIELGIRAMKAGCEALVYDNVMSLTANAARGVIIAPPKRKLCVADLANIEGRKLTWLAGEEWKLQAFRDYDTIVGHDAKGKAIRKGHDLYKIAYARSFNVSPGFNEKTMDGYAKRQIGKVQELALGYEGGVGAFLAFAAVYNVDLQAMTDAVLDTLSQDVRADAVDVWVWAKKHHRSMGLPQDVYVACEALKRLWRDAHPAVVQLWRDLSDGIKDAIRNPGITFKIGTHLAARRDGAWLRIRLPSGRCLCYVKPQIDDKGGISYMGVNQYTKQWNRISSFGGKFAENVTQASSRDVLADAMPRAEQAGYEIVLTVHDELLTETPDTDDFTADGLVEIMQRNPQWAQGLPLAAAGFEAYRYRKD